MNNEELKKFVNKIFQKKGYPPVKNFGKEFSDGSKFSFSPNIFLLVLFQLLFNLMYDEKIDCHLRQSALLEDRLLNWSRINSIICFNYLQQRLYLVEPTMKSLAKGVKSECIFKLIRVLINTQQQDYAQAVAGDTKALNDIADEIETDQPLFTNEESMNGTILHDKILDGQVDEDGELGLPQYVQEQI